MLLDRISHNSLDRRRFKLLGRRNNTLINNTSIRLLIRGINIIDYKEATKIWHTGMIAIRMDISEDVDKLEVLGEP